MIYSHPPVREDEDMRRYLIHDRSRRRYDDVVVCATRQQHADPAALRAALHASGYGNAWEIVR